MQEATLPAHDPALAPPDAVLAPADATLARPGSAAAPAGASRARDTAISGPAIAPGQIAPLGRALAQYGWLAGSALVLLAAVIAERWLLASHIFPGDPWSARVGESHKWWLVWDITRLYQQVGRPLVAIGEVAVIGWWLWRAGERRALVGLPLALAASATCGLIKIICGPTPLWLSLHHVGTNFPSGVVTFMTATGGYLALVAWRRGGRLVAAVLLVAIAGAGPARVLGGQHLLSDVIGGYMLGVAWLLVAYMYLVGSTAKRFSGPDLALHAPYLES